jgi:hypothetical protein
MKPQKNAEGFLSTLRKTCHTTTPKAFKILKKLRTETRENVRIHPIKKSLTQLFSKSMNINNRTFSQKTFTDNTSFEELTNIVKHSRNNKASEDRINMQGNNFLH